MYNNTMTNIVQDHPSVTKQIWKLTIFDRCDKCQAQAFIKVEGKNGSLYFCGHHYNKIANNSTGYANLMTFAFNVIDERNKMV